MTEVYMYYSFYHSSKIQENTNKDEISSEKETGRGWFVPLALDNEGKRDAL